MYDIALSAETSKIWDLVTIVKKYRDGIAHHSVVASLDSGLAIRSMTGIDLTLLPCGWDGGYLQLARLVKDGNLRMAIFLHDPLLRLDDPGVMEFLRSCNVRNLPFANNVNTAEFILHRFLEIEMATSWRCPEARPDHNLMHV